MERKKRGKERRKKEEKKKKKRRKNQLFCYILRPIFVGGACGGLYGRGALAPPHNPSDPTKLALRLISTHYSMLVAQLQHPFIHKHASTLPWGVVSSWLSFLSISPPRWRTLPKATTHPLPRIPPPRHPTRHCP